MRKSFLLISVVVSGLVISFGFLTVAAQALDDPINQSIVLTEKQIKTIGDRCLASKVALDKLHSTDALLRVNLGQQYENISLRLMAPFNSRMVLNSYDAVNLVSTTAQFNQTLDEFRNQYRIYESSISSALNIDCQKQPVEYYQAIENARDRRAKLYQVTLKMNTITADYLNNFEAAAKLVLKEQGS